MITTSSIGVGSGKLQKLEPTPRAKNHKILTRLWWNIPRDFSLADTGFLSIGKGCVACDKAMLRSNM
jgi:hypothetical protein